VNGGEDVQAVAEALTRLGERKLTWPMLCERAGVDHVISDPLWRALGFPDVPPDEPAYTEDDLRALRIAVEGLQKLDGDERDQALELIVRETRTVSGYLARIAETEVDALAELHRLGLRERVRAETLEKGVERSPLGWLIMYVLRRRLDEAIKRRGSTEIGAEPLLVVGFIDLVDFSRTSTGLDAAEFGRVLGRFEALAWDEITEADGRLIKLIGDEAMFAAPGAGTAAHIALTLIDAFTDHVVLPRLRIGLAAGPAITRDGDYFGQVVHLAARLVDIAEPGTIVVTEELVKTAAADGLHAAALGPRSVPGFPEPLSLFRVTRTEEGRQC